ncbi:LysR substrate-binding domain-containing protein [Castellaniella sp.]|uniref:LysR substrate-binding domain-containing protein n=1 Tax=Castellaniella sp. TaxID=1955812 RepID=UPI00356029B6
MICHSLAVPRPTLPQLTHYPHVLTAQGSSVRQALHRSLEEAELDIEVACEVTYVSTAISMVRAGLGIAILPLSTLDAASCDGLSHTLVHHPQLKRRLGLITNRRIRPSPAAQAFINVLMNESTKPIGTAPN